MQTTCMVFPIFDLPVTKNIASIGVYYRGGQLFWVNSLFVLHSIVEQC